MWKQYLDSRFVVWIRVKADPHDKYRGFSILNRELRVVGYEPVRDVMKDFSGNTMPGIFWVVEEKEVFRAIPELRRFAQSKSWFFPFEFCESFIRPFNYLDFPPKEIYVWDTDEKEK